MENRKERILNELKMNKYLYIMAVPVILYYLLFCYAPMGGLIIAFKDYDISLGIFKSSFVGLKYFKEFFGGIYFTRIFLNTLIISAYGIIFGFPAPIIFALLMNEIRCSWYKRTVQTVTYLPHFISIVVVCGMIVDFFGKSGIITNVLSFFTGTRVNYLSEAKYFRSIYISTNIWQNIGWDSIIYLAALAGIDVQLYEAACIDGAGRFRQLINITIPGIMPTVLIMFILCIGQLLSVGYEKIILLYNAGTYETADVISSYVYRVGVVSARYGYSAAVGLFQSVINFALLVTANAISKRTSGTGLF